MTIELNYDERLYHQHHALSSTQARQILESPARYKWALTQPSRTSDAFDVGSAVHSKILGAGATAVAYPDEHLTPAGAISTKAATVAWADEQRANGLIPVAPSAIRQIDAMAEAVLAHDEARALLEQPGNPEVSVFAHDHETRIDLRARFDYLPDLDTATDPIAVDVKTTRDKATARDFARSISTYRYDVQQGHYLDTLTQATGRDDIRFRYIVVEKTAPYFVAVHQLDDLYADIGIDAAREARRTLRQCLDTDRWPTGLEDIQLIDAPNWLVTDIDIQIGA